METLGVQRREVLTSRGDGGWRQEGDLLRREGKRRLAQVRGEKEKSTITSTERKETSSRNTLCFCQHLREARVLLKLTGINA